MLDNVNFPLTNAQISGFILEKEYTNYFTLQQVFADLLDADLIRIKTTHNTSFYHITAQGEETLRFFQNRISDMIKEDIQAFLTENKYELRKKADTVSDYYKSTSGDYIVHCQVTEGENSIIEINLAVPTEESAQHMCSKWTSSSQEIYSYIIKTLNRMPD